MQKKKNAPLLLSRPNGSASASHPCVKPIISDCYRSINEVLRFLYHASSRNLSSWVVFSGRKGKRNQLCDEFWSFRKCLKWQNLYSSRIWIPLNIFSFRHHCIDDSPWNFKERGIWDSSRSHSKLEFDVISTLYYLPTYTIFLIIIILWDMEDEKQVLRELMDI